jgi:hypothetical protein
MFLSCAKKEIILLIDDANSKLEYDQLQNVLKLASVKKKIIVVCTRNTFVDHNNENLEAHFKKSVKYLSWENLSPHVKNSLLNDEKKIIDFIDNCLNTFHRIKILFLRRKHFSNKHNLSNVVRIMCKLAVYCFCNSVTLISNKNFFS